MRVLGLDPGAKRMGWAILDKKPLAYVASGVDGLDRGETEEYQKYRRRLISYWLGKFPLYLSTYSPTLVCSEIVPAVGSGNFVVATQSELAKTVIVVCEVAALQRDIECRGVAANTVKKRLTGKGKATKVAIRNAVLTVFPELEERKKELTETHDECDAIAIALASLKEK